ncbi:hypothetical protein ACQKWADRAFT_284924 [Trichoderma austrokoningii]
MASGITAEATAPSAGPQKHRACDECRFRKVGCTKEPGSCSRCRKEGITCVYSPQKPMGRPRKRRSAQPASSLDAAPTSTIGEAAMLSVGPPSTYIGAAVSSDLAAHLLSQPLPSDMPSYLDLLPEYSIGDSNLLQMDGSGALAHVPRQGQGLFDGAATSVVDLNQATLFDDICFDEIETDSSTSSMSRDFNDSLQKYMVSQYLDSPASSGSSPSSNSTQSGCFTSPKAHPTVSCDCLASLTQALGSLNRLPTDVISAMQVARETTKIAYDTLNCVQCYGDMYDLSKPSPVSRFQNMMCLGALVPSACNAYATILEMVDRDVERAKRENQLQYFNFKDVGGIWANLIDEKGPTSPECALLKSFHNRYLEPETWKATIRAILKVEVYGFNQKTASVSSTVDCSVSPTAFLHCGLKDVITLIDEKNQKRHDIADALMQNHALPDHHYLLFPGPPKPCPPEDRQCVRMLDMARTALSNLAIS